MQVYHHTSLSMPSPHRFSTCNTIVLHCATQYHISNNYNEVCSVPQSAAKVLYVPLQRILIWGVWNIYILLLICVWNVFVNSANWNNKAYPAALDSIKWMLWSFSCTLWWLWTCFVCHFVWCCVMFCFVNLHYVFCLLL